MIITIQGLRDDPEAKYMVGVRFDNYADAEAFSFKLKKFLGDEWEAAV